MHDPLNGVFIQPRPASIYGNTIKETTAACVDEIPLAATAARVRRIPGGIVAPAIMVPDLGRAFATARPVPAGVVGGGEEGRSVFSRTGEDVVLVGANGLPLFRQRGLPVDVVVAVELVDVTGYELSPSVIPGAVTDATSRVDGPTVDCAGHAQISVPGPGAGPRCLGGVLTMSISTLQSAQVGSVALAEACNEEAHRPRTPGLLRWSIQRRHRDAAQDQNRRKSRWPHHSCRHGTGMRGVGGCSTSHGIGFHLESSGSRLKCELVTMGARK